MKHIKPRHITNIIYQNFDDLIYYVTYPGVKPYTYGIDIYGNIYGLTHWGNKIIPLKGEKIKGDYTRYKLRTVDKTTKGFSIARLVAWEFVGQPENYFELEANHADGNPQNNFYKNIEWTTKQENSIHKVIYGLSASSEKHGWNKHQEKIIREIINMILKNKDATEIARTIIDKHPDLYSSSSKYDYDRLRGLVSKIKNRSSWYNIYDEMKGSTTIESIIYEKHIGEEVSRVGLHPKAVIRNNGDTTFGYRI